MTFRRAARALIVAPGPRVLLVQFTFGRLRFWAPPGGGVEPGEDEADALRRELAEEVGLTGFVPGPVVYTHERAYVGRTGGQRDVVVRIDVPDAFAPRPALSPEQLRAENVTGLRWFSLPALRTLHLLPYDLASIVADLHTLRAPLHLDDTRVPPVLVAVSGPLDLARDIGAARNLPVLDAPQQLEEPLTSGQSIVVRDAAPRVLRRLAERTRFHVVRLSAGLPPIDVDGPLLQDPTDLDAALSFVDQVLPPR